MKKIKRLFLRIAASRFNHYKPSQNLHSPGIILLPSFKNVDMHYSPAFLLSNVVIIFTENLPTHSETAVTRHTAPNSKLPFAKTLF